MACISSPVISTLHGDRKSLFQGLVLLGIKQFKKQGLRFVLLDYVGLLWWNQVWETADIPQIREDVTADSLKALGFTITNSFEEISSDPIHWTMMSGT
jgi:hypothetical protein